MREMLKLASISLIGGTVSLLGGCDEGQPAQQPTAEVTPASTRAVSETPVQKRAETPATTDAVDTDDVKKKATTPATVPQGLVEGATIAFEMIEHDFGKVSDTESLEFDFAFKNEGTSILVVKDVKTSCGCTTTKLSQTEFAPGEGDDIHVKFKPKSGGKQSKYITVITNDPDNPQLKLKITADVIPVVGMQPRSLQFGTVERGNSETLTAKVTSQDPGFRIKNVVVNGQNLSANIKGEPRKIVPDDGENVYIAGSTVAQQAEQEIEIVLHDDAPTGRFYRQITVIALAAAEEGQVQKEHTLTLQAHANIVGDIQTTPQFIRVPVLNQGDDFRKDVIVTRRSGQAFKILDVTIADSNMEGVEISTEPYNAGGVHGYRISVSGNAGQFIGSFRGNLIIKTDVPKEGETKIMFNGVVRAPRPATQPAPVTRPLQRGPQKESGTTGKF